MTDTQQPVRTSQRDGKAAVNGEAPASAHSVADAPLAKRLRDQESTDPISLVPEEHLSKANLDNGLHGNTELQKNNSPKADRFDPNFTQSVISATGPKASPRMRKVIGSLIQHVHDFARENEITVDEWMAGVEMVISTLNTHIVILIMTFLV